MASLKDQLLKAGLADKKQARRAEHEKRQAQQRKAKGQAVDDQVDVRAAREAQAERSRALNAEREAQTRARALAAEVAQIIATNKLPREGGEAPYQFADQRKVQKIYVPQAMIEPLARGQLGVVRQDDRYEVVPRETALRLRERSPEVVVALHEKTASSADGDDDPYADFPIPDDLMW
ncbi:DUF2058 domain-containing protein [Isoalcanivorax indicus]|uniref:DUF2058 domain-containing protein n=1 Tax=Isoalcanivorax indicus TaxID=2202653 RepID=UPI000DBA1C5B|nr:DUF2058 domain-containing protein [Isoalcanivorax indicus]